MIVWLAAGCGPRLEEETVAGTRHLFAELQTNAAGTSSVKIDVLEGETALLATARTEAPQEVHVRALFGAEDELQFDAFEWNDSPVSKTNAGFVSEVVSLNWPVQEGDADLVEGRWILEVGLVDGSRTYVPGTFALDVFLKSDPLPAEGAVAVNVVYAGGLDSDEALRAAVDEAKGVWASLYASMGIEVQYDEFAWPEGDLEPPAFGEEEAYVAIAAETPPRTVSVVISDQIEGLPDILGIAGDIPGPLVPTTRSAVQVSALLAAGPDGEFSPEEVRLLAETMAHETGHYLGLFHPVEATWDAWDALEDTPECVTEDTCHEQLGLNLMFPYPLCGVVSCQPQTELTSEQAAVTNRYVGVW